MQIKIERHFLSSHQPLYRQVYSLTQAVEKSYPHYKNWYENVFLSGLKRGERGMILAFEKEQLLGCALIKNVPQEKKLCTLFVHPDFRGQGIGEKLLHIVIDELGQKPLTSVSEKNIPFIKSLFNKFHFRLSALKKDAYQSGVNEYFFNDERAEAIQNKLIPILIQRQKQLKKD